MNWNLLLPPLLALAAAAGGLLFMAAQLRKARLIEDTPTSRIRSAPQGYVELGGFARALGDSEQPLIAPLTQQTCVWFRYRIERYERGGKNSRWNTIESGSSEQWFELDDGGDRCCVDPRGADITPTVRECWKGSSRHAQHSVKTHRSPLDVIFGNLGERFTFGGSDEYRYTEWRIHAGTRLYALGHFETVHGPSGAEREQIQTRALLNQWKQNRDELLGRFDRNGDGEIDLQEWEEARRSAARAAQIQALKDAPAAAISVLCRPPNRSQPYLIATTDPERLARRHRWQAAFGLLVGIGGAGLFTLRHFGS
ncbi:MAG: GIDE domain-containing protein [Spongiibacteraceae bacterium]